MSAITNALDAARSRGDIRFKMDEPCRNGHISERLVSNMACCQCSAEYRPKYQQENMQKWEEYRASNREALAEGARAYRRANKEVISGKDVARRRIKRKEDSVFAMTHRLRARIAMAYRGRLKPASTTRLIGCSFEEFARHIESQFVAGMTWGNRGEWHIDHKRPISAFNLQTEAGAMAAFHWSNCQPLWALDNLKKGSKTINSDMLKAGGCLMTYRNVVSAVVRALAAETINSAGGCDFEPKVQCAKQKGEIVGKEAAFLVDCMVFSRLRKGLAPAHWLALLAQYSTHTQRKHDAIVTIAKGIKSPAPERFRHAAVVTWAMPKLPGQEGKRSTNVLPVGWYCMDNWVDEPTAERTQYRWKSAICKELKAMVDGALAEAQAILDAEELISDIAA